MKNTSSRQFFGPNAGYVLELYEKYRKDPASVDPATRDAFKAWAPLSEEAPTAGAGAAQGLDARVVIEAVRLIEAIRSRGHLSAHVDPLARDRQNENEAAFDRAFYGLSEMDLEALPAAMVGGPAGLASRSALEAIEQLRSIYCGSIGYELDHVTDTEARQWLRDSVESRQFAGELGADAERALLDRITRVEAFEQFLHRAFPGQTRFSIEGTDALVPMLDEMVANASDAGMCELVIGSAHRGRLNILAHVLGVSYADIMARFQGALPPERAESREPDFRYPSQTGDVRYHLGGRRAYPEEDSYRMLVKLAPNPSHLEYVAPVVEGMVRAASDDRQQGGSPGRFENASMAILIHGEAAFTGQGVVSETLNMSRLPGYATGGTLHVLVNNQLAFTEEPHFTRSTRYASDLAKGFGVPVVHVNADYLPACIAVARMAFAYRQRFRADFLIDLIGYRRRGHNEGDEPVFTQPIAYDAIVAHPTVRKIWAGQLEQRGVAAPGEADEMLKSAYDRLQRERESLGSVALRIDNAVQPPSARATTSKLMDDSPALGGIERSSGVGRALAVAEAPAALAALSLDRLAELNHSLLHMPPGFTLEPKLQRMWQRRGEAFVEGGTLDWAHAEALALASILADGTPIRMSGEDTARGTFSQRHIVLHDRKTGDTYTPLASIPEAKASFAIHDSPLSEAAALGFEYGYSVEAPDTLVIWEAQYGDFANGAQVVIDQFIVSGWAKWRQRCSLVMLLPHGYEGQGPEHSSARLERFLQLAADDNLRVAYPSTPAQYFHLLRRQPALLKTSPRPLLVLTPKSLLRNPLAVSAVIAFLDGEFMPVLADEITPERRRDTRRLVLCSGKVYYELAARAQQSPAVAVGRVEELYPFPESELAGLLASYPALREVVWLQEEPENMGAWSYVAPRLSHILPDGISVRYVGRPPLASPAEGFVERHAREQARIVAEGFADVSQE